MEQTKSKVTLYMRPELHKALKLRSVQDDLKMSELAEIVLERYLLEWARGSESSVICPNCQTEFVPGTNAKDVSSKLPVGSAGV